MLKPYFTFIGFDIMLLYMYKTQNEEACQLDNVFSPQTCFALVVLLRAEAQQQIGQLYALGTV